jgi:hypothetical protein
MPQVAPRIAKNMMGIGAIGRKAMESSVTGTAFCQVETRKHINQEFMAENTLMNQWWNGANPPFRSIAKQTKRFAV